MNFSVQVIICAVIGNTDIRQRTIKLLHGSFKYLYRKSSHVGFILVWIITNFNKLPESTSCWHTNL
ncbi:hypothetical protein Hanom_Chr13g01223711 [Helianthus anomalus]